MALTQENICNMAASHIRAEGVLTGVTGNTGPQFTLWYDMCRQVSLRDFDWSFARAQQLLVEHADDPPGNWAYRYTYPTDCVIGRRIWNRLGDLEPPIQWDIMLNVAKTAKTIVTTEADAELIYTVNISDPTLFTPEFAICMSYLLGHYVTMALTGKWTLKTGMLQVYNSMIGRSQTTDGNEGLPQNESRNATWVENRQ